MGPVSAAAPAELAGGAAGALARDASAQALAVSTGEAEPIRFQGNRGDTARAQVLSTPLATRAAMVQEFSAGRRKWHEQTKLLRPGDREVHNTFSGGIQSGPMLQGRDFSGFAFNTPAPPPPSPAPGADTSTQG